MVSKREGHTGKEMYQNMIAQPWEEPEFDDSDKTSVPEHNREENNAERKNSVVADANAKAVLRFVVGNIEMLLCPVTSN
jgi:hypothetical protein